jgi:sigma-E factor negative regulatory protein RseB
MRRDACRTWFGRVLAATAVCAATAVWPVATWAESEAATPPSSDLRSWLLRIHSAASQRNYQGTLVVTTSHGMSSSHVAHYCDGSQLLERVDALDGLARRVYRHNETVLTVWPRTKVARIEQRDAVALFPELISGSENQLFKSYAVLAEGADRVADHDTAVFLLRPRDDRRFAQRLWAERGSGLLLRADVLAADGRILETAAFTNVVIGVRAQPETVMAPMRKLDGYRISRSALQRTSLESEGWRLTVPVPGFTQISCVKRKLEPIGDDDQDNAVDVLQTIYSDGLTHVSVFVEPLRTVRRQPGSGVFGATHALTQQLGSHWVTVIGDVPMATLKQFAAALERLR